VPARPQHMRFPAQLEIDLHRHRVMVNLEV